MAENWDQLLTESFSACDALGLGIPAGNRKAESKVTNEDGEKRTGVGCNEWDACHVRPREWKNGHAVERGVELLAAHARPRPGVLTVGGLRTIERAALAL